MRLKQPIQILKYPFVKAQHWFTDNEKRKIAIIEDFCILKVQAGSFQNVLKIKEVYNPETITQEDRERGMLDVAIYSYYAPDVGFIKSEIVGKDEAPETVNSLVFSDRTGAMKNILVPEKTEALQKDIQSNLIGSWISKSTSGVWTTIQFKNEYFERKILVFENGWHVALKEIGTYEINGRNIIPTITSVIADGEVKDPINDGSSYSFWKVNGKWILFFKGKDSGYNSEDSVSSCSEKNGCYIKGHL